MPSTDLKNGSNGSEWRFGHDRSSSEWVRSGCPDNKGLRAWIKHKTPPRSESPIHTLERVELNDQLEDPLKVEFRIHVQRWRRDSKHMSSMRNMIQHESYLRIMGMGPQVLSYLLEELNARPDHWLIALHAITGEDPAPEGATFREAIDAWLQWGRERGYLR